MICVRFQLFTSEKNFKFFIEILKTQRLKEKFKSYFARYFFTEFLRIFPDLLSLKKTVITNFRCFSCVIWMKSSLCWCGILRVIFSRSREKWAGSSLWQLHGRGWEWNYYYGPSPARLGSTLFLSPGSLLPFILCEPASAPAPVISPSPPLAVHPPVHTQVALFSRK